jgi:hypothetical protein
LLAAVAALLRLILRPLTIRDTFGGYLGGVTRLGRHRDPAIHEPPPRLVRQFD